MRPGNNDPQVWTKDELERITRGRTVTVTLTEDDVLRILDHLPEGNAARAWLFMRLDQARQEELS